MLTNKAPDIAIELSGARLRLRAWQQADVGQLVDAVHESVDSVGRWLPWCHAGYGRDEATDWIARCRAGWQAGNHFAFALFDVNSGYLLGSAGLSQLDAPHRRANLGYWVRQSCQQQGIGAAAARLVAHFGFQQLELARIEIVVLPDNRPSRAVAEKTGAICEAIARNRVWIHDRAHDAAVYGLIAQDLESGLSGSA